MMLPSSANVIAVSCGNDGLLFSVMAPPLELVGALPPVDSTVGHGCHRQKLGSPQEAIAPLMEELRV